MIKALSPVSWKTDTPSWASYLLSVWTHFIILQLYPVTRAFTGDLTTVTPTGQRLRQTDLIRRASSFSCVRQHRRNARLDGDAWTVI
ncbi:hypothetical protein JOB18_011543 [Solea senegalensis]|uniref:Uncharacterized protein n=1 Tax=Solea senegalensis TaxID=28829 RepID=A0AAV6T4J5_SOLSE|nr:hypothetical protein JOB18_011543 [Solea senegalensis]